MPFSPQNAIKHRLKLSHSPRLCDYGNEAYDGNPPEKLHDPNMPRNPTVCQARIMCVCVRANQCFVVFVCRNSYKGHYEGQELHHSIRPEQPRGSREQLAADGERSGAPACLDLQYSFSCQHGQEPGKPAAQFQGYVIPRTCKPVQAALLRLSRFFCFPKPFPAANRAKIICIAVCVAHIPPS